MITQDLWQVLYQILSIIFLKEFIELNNNTNMMIKKRENCGINHKYYDCFLEHTNFKDNVCVVTKIINTSLMKS